MFEGLDTEDLEAMRKGGVPRRGIRVPLRWVAAAVVLLTLPSLVLLLQRLT